MSSEAVNVCCISRSVSQRPLYDQSIKLDSLPIPAGI